jgi:alkylated DNA nucleotide flippase Atl1
MEKLHAACRTAARAFEPVVASARKSAALVGTSETAVEAKRIFENAPRYAKRRLWNMTVHDVVAWHRTVNRKGTPCAALQRRVSTARAPRRRSVRRRCGNRARAPSGPSDEPAEPHLEAVPLSRFLRDFRGWLTGAREDDLCDFCPPPGGGAVTASGLSRGKGRMERPRVYAGRLPCHQSRWCADLEHANIWIENHWKRCRGPLSARGSKAVRSLSEARKVAA